MVPIHVEAGGAGYPVVMQPKLHRINSGMPGLDGPWFRVSPELHAAWIGLVQRGDGINIPMEAFTAELPKRLQDPGNGSFVVLTYAPEVDQPPFAEVPIPEYAAWLVSRAGVIAVAVALEPEITGMAQLREHWPVEELAKLTVMVVGVGSIGGAAATALANYGVGRLILVDPDRLMWHNLVRHVLDAQHVGHFKVDALREHLTARYPDTAVNPFRWNVLDDADLIRSLLNATDLIVCCADGVGPRRAVSHLARRARTPAVLACVLADGGLGEIIRLQPYPHHGCLLCRREALVDAGVIDPEAALEAGYGHGTLHQPMTAVGSDLTLIGELAAKVTVSTALETAGHYHHRLPGEHLTVALQARRGWTGPFDLGPTGSVRWSPATPPRSDCPTCGTP
jgi:molybdopterin/thiamine biosynthesis adenylyltransferase